MAKKIGLRIANNVDTTKVFSANFRGGRGIDDETMALESHNNNVCPTIRTITNFVLICEPMKEKTNKEPKICAMLGRSNGEWHESEHEQRIECREDGVTNTITGVSKDNMVAEPIIIANTEGFGLCYVSKEVSPTVKSSAFQYNNALIEPKQEDPVVLGWVRDEKGNVIKRPSVDVANTVTTAHHYSGNIVEPKRGQKEMGVLERHHQQDFVQHEDGISRALCAGSHGSASHLTKTMVSSSLGFRVRRLTERELFRLMDVSEEDIDKIQSVGISKTQQAKMAGNSIVVSCLYHIFKKMFIDTEQKERQMTLF